MSKDTPLPSSDRVRASGSSSSRLKPTSPSEFESFQDDSISSSDSSGSDSVSKKDGLNGHDLFSPHGRAGRAAARFLAAGSGALQVPDTLVTLAPLADLSAQEYWRGLASPWTRERVYSPGFALSALKPLLSHVFTRFSVLAKAKNSTFSAQVISQTSLLRVLTLAQAQVAILEQSSGQPGEVVLESFAAVTALLCKELTMSIVDSFSSLSSLDGSASFKALPTLRKKMGTLPGGQRLWQEHFGDVSAAADIEAASVAFGLQRVHGQSSNNSSSALSYQRRQRELGPSSSSRDRSNQDASQSGSRSRSPSSRMKDSSGKEAPQTKKKVSAPASEKKAAPSKNSSTNAGPRSGARSAFRDSDSGSTPSAVVPGPREGGK